MSAIANSQNRRNRRDHRASLARSIDLPRGSRGPRSSIRGRFEAALFPFLFFHHLLRPSSLLAVFFGVVARSSNFTNRFPPGDVAQTMPGIGSRFPTVRRDLASSKLDRVAQGAVRRCRGRGRGRKKDRCGEQSHCGPLVALGTYISWGPPGFLGRPDDILESSEKGSLRLLNFLTPNGSEGSEILSFLNYRN